MKRVLITGAGGFIGANLVALCKSMGMLVVGLDRKHPADWTRIDGVGPDSMIVDSIEELGILSRDSLCAIDVCFHLAAESRIQPSFDHPDTCVSSNVFGTACVLEFCRKAGAKMVYAGSSTADDDVEKNIYAATKLQGEQLCRLWNRHFNVPVAITRFYNVYGPGQEEDGEWKTVIGIFERQYRNGDHLTVTGDGSQRRDFTHVSDIVDGMMEVWGWGNMDGSVYNLGTGRNHSILEVANMFVDSDRIQFIPRPPGEAEHTLCDYSKTLQDTGWSPQFRLEDYVDKVKENSVTA